jgi:hypothetical protein
MSEILINEAISFFIISVTVVFLALMYKVVEKKMKK